jgi:hypothetical protein
LTWDAFSCDSAVQYALNSLTWTEVRCALTAGSALSQKASTAAAAEPWAGIVAVGVLDVCVCVVVAPLAGVFVVLLELPLPPQPATSAALAATISIGENIRRLIALPLRRPLDD